MHRRTHAAPCLVLLAGLASSSATTKAAPKTWDGGAGNAAWSQDLNWDPDGVPGSSDQVVLDAGVPVVAESLPVEVDTLQVSAGLSLVSNSLEVSGMSSITGLATSGCCATRITANGPLTIKGTSTFTKRPTFGGSSTTTLEGNSSLLDGLSVDDFGMLVIAGESALTSTGQADPGAVCRITGTLTLFDGSLRSSLDGQWLIEGGTLAASGDDNSDVQGNMVLESGTIRADGVLLELFEHDLRGGTLDVQDNGVIDVRSTGVQTYNAASYTGQGTVRLRGTATIGSNGSGVVSSVTGDTVSSGLELSGTLTLGADLTSTGRLVVAPTANINGPGTLVSNGTAVLAGGALNADIMLSGREATVTGNTTLTGFMDVRTGATLSLNKSISNALGRIRIGGTLALQNFESTSDAEIRPPVDVDASGTIRVRDAELRLRDGGVWEGGTVILENGNAASGFFLLGDQGVQYLITGNVDVDGPNPETTLFSIGSGFGPQPDVRVDGTLTLDVGDGSLAASSAVFTDLGGTGSVVNSGTMILARTLTVGPMITNSGTTRNENGLTFGTIVNSGTWEQSGDVIFAGGSSVMNSGTWLVVSS